MDPNIQYVDPSTGYVDPNSGYVDPNAQFVDPNTGFIDPNAAYTQGSQFVGMEAGVAADPAFPGQQGGVEVQHPAFTDPAQQAAYQQYQVRYTDLVSYHIRPRTFDVLTARDNLFILSGKLKSSNGFIFI